jgi:malate dehydrogenase (oxaloacetate-decarboxylating)(NADP+)
MTVISSSPSRGVGLLNDPTFNKGSAFSEEERDAFGLRGLLPPRVFTQEEQIARNLKNLRNLPNPLDRYISLTELQHRNWTLFYRLLADHLEEFMPVVYTPTVGQACLNYGRLFRNPHGLFVTAADKGRIAKVLANWPARNVKVIVITDGERILGLGDLGAYGMGIPVGKLALYTVCAGVNPEQCLPVTLDVGTDNAELLSDPMYLGLNQRRLRGPEYDALVEEFVEAANARWPGVLIQWEDFGTNNAFRLLEHYRDRCCSFNDDIEGTASVALAGLYSALRITGATLADQRILYLGAGEAGLGIGSLVTAALVAQGMPAEEARLRNWFFDSRGLVVHQRTDLSEHKRVFAHHRDPEVDFLTAIREIKPTAIIGVAAQPGRFDRAVLEAMAEINQQPIVFALSNPTSKAECTAREAYQWTGGRAIYASGSPFDPVTFEGRTFRPGQGNNAYIFPGVGLAVVSCGLKRVNEEMFAAAARALAERVEDEHLAQGLVYPPLSSIRSVSVHIAAAVAEVAYKRGLATLTRPTDLTAHLKASMYDPVYPTYA